MEADGKKALVAGADIVAAEVVEKQESVVVRGIFQFIINKDDESTDKIKSAMQKSTEKIISTIDALKRRPVVPIQQYASTKDAAVYLDVDPSFLTKAQKGLFKEGVHYFRPEGSTILRWDLKILEKWLRTAKEEEDHGAILDKMFA